MPASRLLVVPAAGLGSRLGATMPKLLVPVAGVPMIDRILNLYRRWAAHVVVVVNPSSVHDVEQHLEARRERLRIDVIEQPAPTGMLDAILLAVPAARDAAGVWITWCDQVAVHPRTVERLAAHTGEGSRAPFVMPTVRRANPYIHFARDNDGRITQVLHRREGDAMPGEGESDMGLFAMSSSVFSQCLPRFARDVEVGHATRERNFLPFIPWLARTQPVVTFPCEDPMEAVGVNTPEELGLVEKYLSERSA
jgi:bifunctional UDP-N-acetylglucosamine pyrophosphorylase/glucosamine-1-phosphate N-acetyltransferase